MNHLKMNRKRVFVFFMILFITGSVFAQNSLPEFDLKAPLLKYVSYFAITAAAEDEYAIPHGIANNEFFIESIRLSKLAHDTFDYGDYDASAGFAEEAIYYARLSDEYIADQLISEARRYLNWADENNIVNRYPNNYNLSRSHYNNAVILQANEEWTEASDYAIKCIEILAALQMGTVTADAAAAGTLPRQYTVRTWAVERDCLWNIAGYPWIYGDPWRWRTLYEANKSKLPDPNNPDWIEPGMILDIPSIRGEPREGMWTP